MNYRYNKPIEMPRGSHFGSDYWIAYSKKLNRRCCFFSLLEYANFLHLEMNSNVKYFCEQPLKIQSDTSPSNSSVFDFWVLYVNENEEFQEIKYSSELEDLEENRVQKQIRIQKEWCRQKGYLYKVITEKELLDPNRFMNLKRMQFAISNTTYDFVPDKALLSLLKAYKKLSLEQICAEFKSSISDVLHIVSIQYYLGYIDMDLVSRPIDYKTEICLCENVNLI